LKPFQVTSIIATVRSHRTGPRSQILCHLTAKMTCEPKSLTIGDSKVITVRMPKFESVDWHKVNNIAFKFYQI